jgi:NADH-quinone oxidoreductase subunit E
MPFALTSERERDLEALLAKYPTRKAACIPLLHLCQAQNGHVDDDIIDFVATRLGLPPVEVKGVATFYSVFNHHPVGKHEVWVCRTLPCALRGAGEILAHFEQKLGIQPGDTTPDGKITLRTAECLASCATGPMMQVDKEYYENLSVETVDAIITRLTS